MAVGVARVNPVVAQPGQHGEGAAPLHEVLQIQAFAIEAVGKGGAGDAAAVGRALGGVDGAVDVDGRALVALVAAAVGKALEFGPGLSPALTLSTFRSLLRPT